MGAFSATDAFVFVEHHLGCLCLAFGVVTPGAAQVAPFEKNRRADAGAIYKGIALYVK